MEKNININSIFPVEAKVFYEDNVPYLWYKGKVDLNGKEWFVIFPKIGLRMENVSITSEANFLGEVNTVECTFAHSSTGKEEIFRVEENLNWEREDKNFFDF